MLPENIAKKLILELKGIFHDTLRSVILFGSCAKGTAQPYSDIDILIILNKKLANWTERRDLEIELRKRFYRTVGQVSPKVGSVEELEAALKAHNPLILNILDSGVTLYDDGAFAKLKEHLIKPQSSQRTQSVVIIFAPFAFFAVRFLNLRLILSKAVQWGSTYV